jgi:hypothetical protein
MRQGWKQVALAVAAVAGMTGHDAVAAVCFPSSGGVPGEGGSGPPNWWSGGSAIVGTATNRWLDDPRWRGAFSHRVMTNQWFQVVVENTGGTQYLVMSWEDRADATGAGDQLYFGIWDDDSATGNIYRLTRDRATATTVAGARWNALPASSAFHGRIFSSAGALGSVTWSGTSAGPGPNYPLPTWLTSDARVDVPCGGGVCDRWAFRIRARIDPAASTTAATPSGIKISNATLPATRNFRFWYEIQDSGAIGTTRYSFPSGLAAASESGATPSFPDPSGWKQAQLGASSSCDGDILFNWGDVYVNNVGSNQLDFTSNTFHATPKNNVPSAVKPSIQTAALRAKFRIANWGSAGYNSPEWTTACSGSGSGPVLSGADFDLSCPWTGFNACPYRPTSSGCGPLAGTKDRHQCVLAELELPSGSLDQFSFSVQSVYQNMNFDVNSTLVRQATIDIKGLGPMPGGAANRDVFLYVQTRNLPAKIGEDEPPPPADDNGAPVRGNVLPPRQRFKELQLPATGAIGTKESARIQAAVQAGTMTMEQVEQIMPTYIVYVWHDTGRTLATAGGPSKELEAQPSFGLYLAHDGELEGWKHSLTGAGAVPVGPNLYRFSPPNDSTFPVTITIEPIGECTGPFCGIWRWLWILLALLLLLLILFAVLRKKQPPPAPPPGP